MVAAKMAPGSGTGIALSFAKRPTCPYPIPERDDDGGPLFYMDNHQSLCYNCFRYTSIVMDIEFFF